MLEVLKKEQNKTYTENGAVTLQTTQSDCLDLFATIGALRNAKEREIEDRFLRAYVENPDIAMKILFYARDIRGGLGERKVFRTILAWLAHNYPQSVIQNLERIAQFGRFDDVLCLLDTPCQKEAVAYLRRQLESDAAAMEQGREISLLAKWLPSVNASSGETVRLARKLAKALEMRECEYRKLVVRLRAYLNLLENHLRKGEYTFSYEKQPSKALYQYRRAFVRNDAERYRAFLESVENGRAVLHTAALTPYDVVAPLLNGYQVAYDRQTEQAVEITWKQLEDFTGGENALVVLDGSGSMYCGGSVRPAAVALSLAIYFAERNTGEFKNHFITFSHTPRLVQIKGKTLAQKAAYCASYDEVADTNIQKVFELLLDSAVKHKMRQEDLPAALYFITDMEFNACTQDASLSNFAYAKQLFAQHGYRLPQVVFWNVNSRSQHQPVQQNEQGVILVSGCTPRIFRMLANRKLSPYAFMIETIGAERYREIVA